MNFQRSSKPAEVFGAIRSNEHRASGSKDHTEPLKSAVALISKEDDAVNDHTCIIDPKSILKR